MKATGKQMVKHIITSVPRMGKIKSVQQATSVLVIKLPYSSKENKKSRRTKTQNVDAVRRQMVGVLLKLCRFFR